MINRSSYIGLVLFALASSAALHAQVLNDSSRFQLHFQQTVVTQGHSWLRASYSGTNSLNQTEDAQTSLTTTLYTGAKLWKYGYVYFNPEIAGGSGLSSARGIAGFSNGETFRVGNPKPQVYVARLYFDQYFALTDKTSYHEEDVNQLAGNMPDQYLRIVGGRLAVSDFFDCNAYSHDPRTQFLNWSLMGNGAYDYAANTRGYTWGGMIELGLTLWSFRFAATMVPRTANASHMDPDLNNALAKQVEAEYRWGTSKKGAARFLLFHNKASMGTYTDAVMLAQQTGSTPDITLTRTAGNTKYGAGVNIEQQLTANTGMFARASWNDGKHETWMFTEIDNSLSVGISGTGSRWKRVDDVWGIAAVSNGISTNHQQYLKAGGYGFMVGDGNLSYARENIAEVFYNAAFHSHFFITPDYQFVVNPAYNKDRGPVHIFALRVRTTF
jgi:high affinity Mn2+ porin